MEDFAVHGDRNRLGRVDGPHNVEFRDLVVVARDGYDAFRVDGTDMVAGNADPGSVDIDARHELGLLDRFLD